MNEFRCIKAKITLLSKDDGGRETIPILSECIYRPHIVLGNPNQRRAIVVGNEIQEIYLGVAFLSSPKDIEFNKPFLTEMVLMYYPDTSYDSVIPGATFTIREGAKIIGYGEVRKLFTCELTDNGAKAN
jgi:hypothetical protein